MTREQKRSLLLIAAAAVLLIGLHFVPVTGWLKLVLYLIPYLLVGGETLVDACKGIYNRQPFDENLLMAVATSLDALAAGVSFAFMDVPLPAAVLLIAAVTFAVCFAGGVLGSRVPAIPCRAAGILGGAVLCGIGAKLLLEGIGAL